jgi:hypothetical protein
MRVERNAAGSTCGGAGNINGLRVLLWSIAASAVLWCQVFSGDRR